MTRLTFHAIDVASDLPTKEVEMSEWGGTILVRGLSKGAYDDLRAKVGEDALAMEIETIVACVADPVLNYEQANKLRYKSVAAYKRLHEAIAEVNRVEPVASTKSLDGAEPGGAVPDDAGSGPGEEPGRAAEDAAG